MLPGCATTRAASASAPTTQSATGACLPPVKVEPSRVIRHVVGLRPYRASGYVVRAEALGDTRLIHNYGHGGAGITLSWGTSLEAVKLGVPGRSGAAAVIGAGIMGLTTARLLQEAGLPVTIYTAALPPDTTSNIAGGQWSPFGHYREDSVTPEWRARFHAALAYSWRRFQIMVGDDYGVRWLPTYTENTDIPDPADPLDRYHPAGRRLKRAEHPFPVEGLSRFDTLYVETGRYLRQLLRDVQTAGGKVEVRRFAAPAELQALPERLVFNCTGLGARDLFGDQELRPARGQLAVLLPQPEVTYAFSGQAGYMFPRADGVLLGGTFQLDDWSLEPDPRTADRMIRSHQTLFEGFRCGPRLDAWGLLPA